LAQFVKEEAMFKAEELAAQVLLAKTIAIA
jgi:hypothetical protein